MIAFTGDVHLGNHQRFGGEVVRGVNRRCRLALDVFRRALEAATAAHCSVFVVLGDLFDTARPPPQLIAEVGWLLTGWLNHGMRDGDRMYRKVILLVGNHEQSSEAPGDHALAPLACIPGVEVVDEPKVVHAAGVPLILLPSQRQLATKLRMGLLKGMAPSTAQRFGPAAVVGVHLGISDGSTPPWLRGAHDHIPADELLKLIPDGVTDVYAANWHEQGHWAGATTVSWQVGALCPTGFDNPSHAGTGFGTSGDLYGRLHVRREGGTRHVAVPGPRFLRCRGGPATAPPWVTGSRSAKPAKDYSVFVEWRVSPDDLVAATETLRAAVEDGTLAGGEVLPLADDQPGALRAAVARATSVDEAVSRYVGEMALPVGVDRGDVRQAVDRFMGG